MKVYVDKLPKSCEECPMCRSGKLKLQRKDRYVKVEQCVFEQYKYQTIDDEIDTCPLQSIANHDKQVRKQVCDEIYEKCEPLFRLVNNYDNGDVIERNELVDILDQIEKGE